MKIVEYLETSLSKCSLWRAWRTSSSVLSNSFCPFLCPATLKWQSIMLYHWNCLSVCQAVHPAWVCPSTLHFRSLRVFFDDVRQTLHGHWYRGMSGLGLQITELWPLINVKTLFFLNIFRTNGWILIKFCIWIDIWVRTITYYFSVIFNSYGPWLTSEFHLCSVSCELLDFDQILYLHWYWQNLNKNRYKFVPWLLITVMSKFCFHWISWEQIDRFW